MTGGLVSAVTYLERQGFIGQCKGPTNLHRGVLAVCLLYTDNLLALATAIVASACTNKSGAVCNWVERHAEGWQRLAQRSAESSGSGAPQRSYFLEAQRRGLPANAVAKTPRVKNLLELVAAGLWAQGVNPFHSDAILDISQSYGRHALRVDGLLPTGSYYI